MSEEKLDIVVISLVIDRDTSGMLGTKANYVKVHWGDDEMKTDTIYDEDTPVYDKTFELGDGNAHNMVRLSLWQENMMSDDYLAECSVTTDELKIGEGAPESEHTLLFETKKVGTIKIKSVYVAPP